MSKLLYISIVALILLGGVSYFGYWALNQNKLALDAYDVSYNQLGTSLTAYTQLILERATDKDTLGAATASEVSFTFPTEGDELYIGCDYQVAWETATTTSTSSVAVKSLDIALIDAETREVIGPIASGLSATSTDTESTYLDWKVGKVWPGKYHILISKINEQKTSTESAEFTVRQVPEGENKKDVCL
ncbi:MAG: hypothetical protein AAB439_01070 [Patescibacteria group bacterium]